MIKFFLWLVTLLAACGLAAAAWMGAVQPVVITERTDGPFLLVYRELGNVDLKKIDDITTELDKLLRDAGVEQRRQVGVFFPDDRVEIGLSVAGVTKERLEALTGKPKIREIAAQRYMVTRFPYRNRASYLVGLIKIAPALKKYGEAHGYRKSETLLVHDPSGIICMQAVVKGN